MANRDRIRHRSSLCESSSCDARDEHQISTKKAPNMHQSSFGSESQASRPSYSQALRTLREARGVTQDSWAIELGIGRTTVQRWENGQAVPHGQMEEAIIALCAERGLFRRYESGPLRGLTFTPEILRAMLAEARLGSDQPRDSQSNPRDDEARSSGPALESSESEPERRLVAEDVSAEHLTRGSRLFAAGAAVVFIGVIAATVYLLARGSGAPDVVGADQVLIEPLTSIAATRPDGFITFRSEKEGQSAVFVVDFDGSNLAMAFDDPLFDSSPKWSPDGRRLVFTSRAGSSGNRDIFITALEDGEAVQLTQSPADDLEPAWAPDGSQIAFVSGREGAKDIFVMTPTGAITDRLTSTPADDLHPAWSSEGERIAFTSTRDGNREIYVMDSDGSNLMRLTDHAADDDQPAWSPDGQMIAFQSRRDGNREIYIMNIDGTGLRRLTNDVAEDLQPTWSPDGEYLAFVSTRDGQRDIYVVRSDGTGLRKLTDKLTDKDQPSWVLPKEETP
ncbi:MAG: helix-turn-helix domain-containing protein [Dehalococcoidia bacterium]|nr:helix-turn-helix domain-containing protein [Dehalococcoidia bacterium]